GYAPFIVRPRRLGTRRVAVVLATNTWAAYNFTDTDGDGWGGSGYVTGKQHTAELSRLLLDVGVPFRLHAGGLGVVAWLKRPGQSGSSTSDRIAASGRRDTRPPARPLSRGRSPTRGLATATSSAGTGSRSTRGRLRHPAVSRSSRGSRTCSARGAPRR